MAYVEVRYYRSYGLEVREFGDTGWAVHVYTPGGEQDPHKLTVTTTTDAAGLHDALDQARAAVDSDLTRRSSRSLRQPRTG